MSDQSLTVWVVGAVAAGILGTLAFLVRNAFESVNRGLDGLNAKLDSMRETMARGDGDRRVLEARMNSLVAEVAEMKRDLRELSEGK